MVYTRKAMMVYRVHSPFNLRLRLRVVSSVSVAVVICVESFDSAFSKEAGEDVSS